MSKIAGMAAILLTLAVMTNSAFGLVNVPDRNTEAVFDQYSSDSQDLTQSIEAKVGPETESNTSDIEQRIEERVEEQTQKLKKQGAVTGAATAEESSGGFFSLIMSFFG